MHTKKSVLSLVVVVLLGIGAFSYSCLRRAGSGSDAGWGRGKIKASERYFYEGRFEVIMKRWRDTVRHSKFDREGRFVRPHDVYLHIDLDKEAIWLEEQGEVRPEDYMELPANLKWMIYHLTEQDSQRLPAQVCLQSRGMFTRHLFPEIFCVLGNGRGRDHVGFRIESAHGNSDYGAGPGPTLTALSPRERKEAEVLYESILVSQEEYTQALDSRPSDGRGPRLQRGSEQGNAQLAAHKAIYQQIDAQITRHGYTLDKIEHHWALDYSAMLVKVECDIKEGLLDLLSQHRGSRDRPRDMEFLFKANHLDEGIWYAKSYPYMQRTGQPEFLDLEFIVRDSDRVSNAKQTQWIAQGRAEHAVALNYTSDWAVSLANGTRVEFLGVQHGLAADAPCWAPHGSPLDQTVLFYDDHDEADVYHMLLKITWAKGTIRSQIRADLDPRGGRSWGRSGAHKDYEIVDIPYRAYGSRERTTMKLVITCNGGAEETIHFRDISLVLGKAFGFEILFDEEN